MLPAFKKCVFKVMETAYWPLCRSYARILGNKPADAFFTFLCSIHFFVIHGFWPEIKHPTRFSEKLWHRMLYDRNPVFTLIADKLAVRDYVAAKADQKYLIPLLWKGEVPDSIPFASLPSEFVVKANHGCKYNIIITDKSQINERDIKNQLSIWLKENYCRDYNLGVEWGYRNIPPAVLIESFIGTNKTIPLDYKFYCFNGRVELITLHHDRFHGHSTAAFDRNFHQYHFNTANKLNDVSARKPDSFDEMVHLAEKLSADFDFMRVDLYACSDRIYFGELTPHPAGILSFRGFDLPAVDETLGRKWIHLSTYL